jgi:hypothetical protein
LTLFRYHLGESLSSVHDEYIRNIIDFDRGPLRRITTTMPAIKKPLGDLPKGVQIKPSATWQSWP